MLIFIVKTRINYSFITTLETVHLLESNKVITLLNPKS